MIDNLIDNQLKLSEIQSGKILLFFIKNELTNSYIITHIKNDISNDYIRYVNLLVLKQRTPHDDLNIFDGLFRAKFSRKFKFSSFNCHITDTDISKWNKINHDHHTRLTYRIIIL